MRLLSVFYKNQTLSLPNTIKPLFTFQVLSKFSSTNSPILSTKKKQPKTTLLDKFSQVAKMSSEEVIPTKGRAWKTAELRIKSTEDLHKLWYICVREKNILLADKTLNERMQQEDRSAPRLKKLKLTMKRILTVIDERAQMRRQYREKLEQQYVEKKREELQKNVEAQEPKEEITWELLRAKYHELRKGIDNVDYLERICKACFILGEKREKYQERKQMAQVHLKDMQEDEEQFKSFWQKEMNYKERPLQEEILRAHVKNWKQLNLRQRKIILGFLNAKRARDAKSEFVKQLKIMGQKIAHQEIKERSK